MTKGAIKAAVLHGVEIGFAALMAEITLKGWQGYLYGDNGKFEPEDLLMPLAVFGAAAWRGMRLYLAQPPREVWTEEQRAAKVTQEAKP